MEGLELTRQLDLAVGEDRTGLAALARDLPGLSQLMEKQLAKPYRDLDPPHRDEARAYRDDR